MLLHNASTILWMREGVKVTFLLLWT
jgi:hypothetical protein